MVAIQIVVLFLILIVIPTIAGGMFDNGETGFYRLIFRWVSGQMMLWAGFQLICVPLILNPRNEGVKQVMILFCLYVAAAILLAMGKFVRCSVKNGAGEVLCGKRENDRVADVMLFPVLALLILQLVLAVVLAYNDGDDAFYVAVSTVAADSGTMYQILPYTGGWTGLDARHGLAPLPIWVAVLARLSGLRAVTVAQIVLPVALITMTYAVLALIGRYLFKDKRRSRLLFLLFVELLVIFGGYSLYTAENFLLARTAQGKSVLANIVIPFVFLLLLYMADRLENRTIPEWRFWLLLGMTTTAGCLCSTLGTLLVCLLLAVSGGCVFVCYRKWKLLPLLAACGIVPVAMAVLYLMLD